MNRLNHMCAGWLQRADRKLAVMGSSWLKKGNSLGNLHQPSRIVRHNRPSRWRTIRRQLGRQFGRQFGRHANMLNLTSRVKKLVIHCLQLVSRKIALTGSKWLVRHNTVSGYARRGSRAVAATVTTMMVGAGVLVVAHADESLSEFTRRAYVGIGGGGSFLEPKTPNANLTVSSNTDAGFHIVGGYDFTSRLSAEIYYADLGAADIAFIGTDIGDIKYQVYGLSGIGYIYNSRSGFQARSKGSGMGTREGLSLFGRVGVGGVTAESELDYKVNHSTHLALGLGAEYGFRNGLAVRGEYRALDTDQHYGSLSLVKRIGDVRTSLPVAATAAALPAVVTPEVSAVTPQADAATLEADVVNTPNTASFAGVETVNFAFDKSDITEVAAITLNQIAAVLGAADTNIMLEGHTDWIASERYNYQLSLRRAESVRRYLEDKGINRERISVRGYGETRPIALNDTIEGRARNRRVDIRIR